MKSHSEEVHQSFVEMKKKVRSKFNKLINNGSNPFDVLHPNFRGLVTAFSDTNAGKSSLENLLVVPAGDVSAQLPSQHDIQNRRKIWIFWRRKPRNNLAKRHL